jgi:hypothetical protein
MGNSLWLERLMADIWHLTSTVSNLELSGAEDQLMILVHEFPSHTADGASGVTIDIMDQLAQTAGGTVQISSGDPSTLVVSLPRLRGD